MCFVGIWASGSARTDHTVAASYWIEALRNLTSSAWTGNPLGRGPPSEGEEAW